MSNGASPIKFETYVMDDNEFRQAIGPTFRDELKFLEFIIEQSEDPSIPLEKIIFNLQCHAEQAGCFFSAYSKRVFEQEDENNDEIDRELKASFDQAVASASTNPDTLRHLYAMQRLLIPLGWLK